MTIAEFQKANIIRNPKAFPECGGWQPVDWSNAMAGEVGEVCNKIKKLKRDGETREKIHDIGLELADVISYACLLASSLNVNLETACTDKFNQVSDSRGEPRL